MELRNLSKEELMEYLVNGIPLPESAFTNKETLKFYFEELNEFINKAENEFWATLSEPLSITVAFGNIDYIIMRLIEDKLLLFMAPNVADDINNITSEEASDIVGLVYGIIVYNEKWNEVTLLANQIIDNSLTSTSLPNAQPIKMNSIDMKNLKEFVKQNRKFK